LRVLWLRGGDRRPSHLRLPHGGGLLDTRRSRRGVRSDGTLPIYGTCSARLLWQKPTTRSSSSSAVGNSGSTEMPWSSKLSSRRYNACSKTARKKRGSGAPACRATTPPSYGRRVLVHKQYSL
ncbi:hypothetical protein BAE44_0000712, partial [Dichanthelium oligosanthes]